MLPNNADFLETETSVLPLPDDLPKKVHFKPWHKPRKQWVRYHQWLSGMNLLFDKYLDKDNTELRYLSLPGDDLLDIRMLGEGCQRKGRKLYYLGFNSARSFSGVNTELNISESELARTGYVVEGSKVLPDSIEALSSEKSAAYILTRNAGPFHVINLDLCQSVAIREANYAGDTYFKALKNLVDLQLNFMKDSWLLFLTTRCNKDSIATSAMHSLIEKLRANLTASEEFKLRLGKVTKIPEPEHIIQQPTYVDTLSEEAFLDCFAVSFSKWLLQLSIQSHHFEIEMLPACKYATGSSPIKNPDMLSLGFRFNFKFQPTEDKSGLGGNGKPQLKSEIEQGLEMLDKYGDMFDLDEKIAQDETLYKTLLSASADLLEKARFDRGHYIEWVEGGCLS